jgi:hypothetical protein
VFDGVNAVIRNMLDSMASVFIVFYWYNLVDSKSNMCYIGLIYPLFGVLVV